MLQTRLAAAGCTQCWPIDEQSMRVKKNESAGEIAKKNSLDRLDAMPRTGKCNLQSNIRRRYIGGSCAPDSCCSYRKQERATAGGKARDKNDAVLVAQGNAGRLYITSTSLLREH